MSDFNCENCNLEETTEGTNNEATKDTLVNHDGGCSFILYSTGCPKCKILEDKMESKQLDFEVSDDVQKIIDKGFLTAPVLWCKEHDEYMDYANAVKLINKMNTEDKGL